MGQSEQSGWEAWLESNLLSTTVKRIPSDNSISRIVQENNRGFVDDESSAESAPREVSRFSPARQQIIDDEFKLQM
jgi:hypothetical protein